MYRSHRTVALLFIPVLTLLFGWQMGLRFAEERYRDQVRSIEALSDSASASGVIVGDPEKEADLALFWRVWRTLQSRYISPQDLRTRSMLLGAVRGLVEGVGDPYTLFMSPQESQEFHDSLSGDLQGIGAELAIRDEGIVVVAPLKNSPAEGAGLKGGDIITHVNAQSVVGKTLQEVVTLIRGPAGTIVSLTFDRPGAVAPIILSIERRKIEIPSVQTSEQSTPQGTIGVLRLNQFGDDSATEVKTALQHFIDVGIKGLVFDLRFNGGGYLDDAVDIVSLFVKEGNVVSVQHRDGKLEKHFVDGRPLTTDLPMVVLINQGSASAAEITAGALHDLGRAILIGVKSFGKGSVQEVIELPGGSSLRVTSAHWLTPNGRDINKLGIAPAIAVSRTQEDIDAGRDPQMERALQWFSNPVLPASQTGSALPAGTGALDLRLPSGSGDSDE